MIFTSKKTIPAIRSSRPITIGLLLYLLIWCKSPYAQVHIDSSLTNKTINAILIHGNEKTKPSIILREMKHRVGNPMNPILLEEDWKRILNLKLFHRVLIFTESDGKHVRLHVQVTEQWYIFPYPIFFINERDWSKLSYGAGLMHLNFRGRAETLAGLFWLGYNPSVRLEYINPWIGGKHHLRIQTNLYYQKIRSKHYEDEDVTENHLGLQWMLGKRFGYHTNVYFSLGYREVTFTPAELGLTLSAEGKDHLPNIGLSLTWDHRDLHEYPHAGWYVLLSAVKTGLPSLDANYLHYGCDARKYFALGKISTLAFRTTLHLSEGTVPVYDRIYLGYEERIRGHFFETSEGENRILLSAAFRVTLLPIRYYDLADHPQLSNLKFGLSLGFFADTGTTWFQDEKLNRSMFRSGYGLGIHILLPYIHVLRLEVAFDEKGNEQFILDLGVDI